MEFSSRLKNIRLENKKTQQQLAEEIGVSVLTVQNWERGIKKPSMNAIISLAHSLQTTTDYLLDVNSQATLSFGILLSPSEKKLLKMYQSLDDHGKKIVDTVCNLESDRVHNIDHDNSVQFVKLKQRYIPCYTTPSAAGYNIPIDGVDFEMIPVDETVPSDADFAVIIQGDSMYPYISSGDRVYVKKCEDLSIGDVGIFCVDGAMYCKQLYIDDERNLTLVSANPNLMHTNIFVSSGSNVSIKVYGKVLLDTKVELPNYFF